MQQAQVDQERPVDIPLGYLTIWPFVMRKIEVVVMLIGSVIGILVSLYWPAPISYFKLFIIGLGALGALLIYVQAKAIKSAFPSMQRNDWTLAYVLRDAAKEGALPKTEVLVNIAKAMGVSYSLAFGCLIGLGIIAMLRATG